VILPAGVPSLCRVLFVSHSSRRRKKRSQPLHQDCFGIEMGLGILKTGHIGEDGLADVAHGSVAV